MKKILLAVCAIALVSLTGCKKDNTDTDTPQQQTSTEGVYNPAAKIATVTTDDATQQWVWASSKLDRIESTNADGTSAGVQQFGYTGDRMSSATQTVEGIETEMRVNYQDGYISTIAVYTDGTQSVLANVSHNASNKINRMTLDIDESYFNQLLGTLLAGGIGSKLMPKGDSKATLTSSSIAVNFDWNGDNVSRMIVNADIVASVTMSDIAQVIDLQSVLGDLAALASLLTGSYPLTVTLRDTMDLAYDQNHNPLQGFLGTLDPAVLSANNYTEMDNHGIADITLSITNPLTQSPYPITRQVPISQLMNFYYTYNASGWPLTVTDDGGSLTTYTYQ